MPELPEVEVVRAGLSRHGAGRRVEHVTVLDARSARRQAGGASELVSALTGTRLGPAVRRGKFCWIPMGERALVIHLGMSGQMLLHSRSDPLHRHTRIVLDLDEAEEGVEQLRFVDQRLFGGLHVTPLVPTGDHGPGGHSEAPADALIPAPVAHIARDPLDPWFSPAAVLAAMRSRRTGIKRALLDQGLVSGIGNIYADEALWRAGVHYAAPTDTTRTSRLASVLAHSGEVMERALAEGGTSFDSLYVNVNGESGYFSRSLQVYGRAGQACARCGTTIVRETFMNRGSHFCPGCQRRPRSARY